MLKVPEETLVPGDCEIKVIIRDLPCFVKVKPGVSRLFVYFVQKQVPFPEGHWQYKVLQNPQKLSMI